MNIKHYGDNTQVDAHFILRENEPLANATAILTHTTESNTAILSEMAQSSGKFNMYESYEVNKYLDQSMIHVEQ